MEILALSFKDILSNIWDTPLPLEKKIPVFIYKNKIGLTIKAILSYFAFCFLYLTEWEHLFMSQ